MKLYEEVQSLDEMTGVVESALEEYNNTHKNRMNLVIFRYVLEHLSRICRIIKQPGGNALLVGVGGSGRQSLTRLAAAMADYTLFQPEISKSYDTAEWKEDLKVSKDYSYRIAGKFGGELNLEVWQSILLPPNKIPPTFPTHIYAYGDPVPNRQI